MTRFKPKKLAEYLAPMLARHVGLDIAQGMVARRRARARAWSTWRALHDVLDAAFPAIKTTTKRKPRAKTKRAKTRARSHKIQMMIDRGYVLLGLGARIWRMARGITVGFNEVDLLEALATNGVAVRRIEQIVYVPAWACITSNDTQLKKVKRSRSNREAMRALFKVAEENL